MLYHWAIQPFTIEKCFLIRTQLQLNHGEPKPVSWKINQHLLKIACLTRCSLQFWLPKIRVHRAGWQPYPWRISDSRFPRVTSGTLFIYVMVGSRPDYQRLVFLANLFTSTMLCPARMEGTWDSGTTRYGTCLGKYWKIRVLTSAASRCNSVLVPPA